VIQLRLTFVVVSIYQISSIQPRKKVRHIIPAAGHIDPTSWSAPGLSQGLGLQFQGSLQFSALMYSGCTILINDDQYWISHDHDLSPVGGYFSIINQDV